MTWINTTQRDDGLCLILLADGNWSIVNKGAEISACPCCDKPFATHRAAKMVADAVYPEPRKTEQ